ncbi:MAG: hypothetical protein AB8B63_14150 [Granulosicoccus sp.]
MSKVVAGLAAMTVLYTSVSLAQQEELAQASAACEEAVRLIEIDDSAGALEEAKWCVESLEQWKQLQTLTLLPDFIDDYTADELENSSAMGMTVIERTYVSGERSISVTLTSGVASSGFAALAQLGMGLSGSGAGKKIRVQKRTVINLSQTGAGSEYMVQLKSGAMLMINSTTVDEEELLDFIRLFPIADIDDGILD